MSVTLNGTSGLVFSDGTIQGTAGAMAFRNKIINGDMKIDQRNAGASLTVGNGTTSGSYLQYPVDRFLTQSNSSVTGNGAAFTAQRNAGSVTPPPGFSNYVGITVTSAQSTLQNNSVYRYIHRIEGSNISDLSWGSANASAITLSLWVRSSVTGTHGGALNNTGPSGAWRSYGFTYTINAANTWEYKTITIPGDVTGTWRNDNGAGIEISFTFGVSSSWQATVGSWTANERYGAVGSVNLMATNGATLYITGVQLEKAAAATSFEHRPIGTELAMCQRYYQKTFPLQTAAANNAGATGAVVLQSSGSNSLYGSQFQWRYPVRMRGVPTVVVHNPSANNGNVRNLANTTDVAISANPFVPIDESSAQIVAMDTASSAGQILGVHFTANAEL